MTSTGSTTRMTWYRRPTASARARVPPSKRVCRGRRRQVGLWRSSFNRRPARYIGSSRTTFLCHPAQISTFSHIPDDVHSTSATATDSACACTYIRCCRQAADAGWPRTERVCHLHLLSPPVAIFCQCDTVIVAMSRRE